MSAGELPPATWMQPAAPSMQPAGCWDLPPDEVHVWRIGLDRPPAVREQLGPLLSADEQDRAARFHFDRDRHRFVVGRGVLRKLLAGYLHALPEELAFVYGAYGKPALAGRFAESGLCFNLSHTHDLALAAFTAGRQLGVDVEQLRDTTDLEGIVSRFFSPAEVAVFFALPPAERRAAFYNCWTRKEAYLKASGEGFTRPLDSFDVTLAPGDPPRLLRVAGAPAELARWSYAHLDPGPGYVGAVTVEGQSWQARLWDWN